MKLHIILTAIILAVFTSAAFLGCTNEDMERKQVRDKLDEEFEKDTKVIMNESKKMQTMIKELIAEHDKLDKMHAEFDKSLEGKKLEEPDAAMQKQHLSWEREHKVVIKDAQLLIAKFNERHEEHERMEASHGKVPIEQIKKEHEEFEETLKSFRAEFKTAVVKLKEARKQMSTIFNEHNGLKTKYIKPGDAKNQPKK